MVDSFSRWESIVQKTRWNEVLAALLPGIRNGRVDILEVARVACRENRVTGFADSGDLGIAHVHGTSFPAPSTSRP